jgi:copper chaperone CopZ
VVTASHQAGQVKVTYDPALISRDQIAARIQALGYEVTRAGS